MASLLEEVRPKAKAYLDRTQFEDLAAQARAQKLSTTVYIGNVSVYSVEEQIHELMSRCGVVKRIVMVCALIVPPTCLSAQQHSIFLFPSSQNRD